MSPTAYKEEVTIEERASLPPTGQLGGVIGGIIGSTSYLNVVPKAPKPEPAMRVRVSQGVSAGRLLKKVEPAPATGAQRAYPGTGRANRDCLEGRYHPRSARYQRSPHVGPGCARCRQTMAVQAIPAQW